MLTTVMRRRLCAKSETARELVGHVVAKVIAVVRPHGQVPPETQILHQYIRHILDYLKVDGIAEARHTIPQMRQIVRLE